MSATCTRLIALLTSVLLAVPPGFCNNFVARPKVARSAPPSHSCCQMKPPAAPADSKQDPSGPCVQCCCVQIAILSQDALPSIDLAPSPEKIILADLHPTVQTFEVPVPLSHAPPLHVLQCVWLC